MKTKLVALLSMLVFSFVASGCGNPDVISGTVTEKREVDDGSGKKKCVLMILEDKDRWEKTSIPEEPQEVKVLCDEKFEKIKVGDHWEKSS